MSSQNAKCYGNIPRPKPKTLPPQLPKSLPPTDLCCMISQTFGVRKAKLEFIAPFT